MHGEQKIGGTCLSAAQLTLFAAVVACCCCFVLGCRNASGAATVNAAAKTEDPATRDLRAIGNKVASAVIARDVNTLLQYDHQPEDQASLADKTSDLYCYLFDSTCISGTNKRAVYDLFSTAPKLGIDASVTSVEGRTYGLLMFYDKSQISESELYTPGFLCTDKGMKGTASWRFIQTDGEWNTSTLFGYKTDTSCGQ
jgi:hypothetical protein